MHKSLNIENIRNLSKSIPGESNFFHANRTFCAVPLGGAGGLIGILQVDILSLYHQSSLPTSLKRLPVTVLLLLFFILLSEHFRIFDTSCCYNISEYLTLLIVITFQNI